MKSFCFWALAFFIFSSCNFSQKRVVGNGIKSSQERQIGTFTGVRVKGSLDVEVAPGSAHSLKITGDENLLDLIEVENKGGILEISTQRDYNLRPEAGLKIYAVAPQFTELEVSGSGNVTSQALIRGNDNLVVQVKGSGDARLQVDAPQVEAEIWGSGKIALQGRTQQFSASIKGSGDLTGWNLLSENTTVDISGSGNAEVFASKSLQVDIKGSGDVAYKGTATVNQRILGSGAVRKIP